MALVAVILSIIQMVYIPIIMSEKEADHMDVVENQFSQLKSVIEIQSMMGAMETDMPIVNSPMSSPITLGTKRLPYFVSQDARGEVKIIDKEDAETDGRYRINIQPMSIDKYPSGIWLTSIEYTAYNHYYLEGGRLQYILEGGAIILNQSGSGETMKVAPSISVENRTILGYIKIYWNIPVFVGVSGKKITPQDYGDYYIRTNYSWDGTPSPQPQITQSNGGFIDIYTKHLDLWYEYLTNSNGGLLYEYIQPGLDNISVNVINNEKIRIQPEGDTDIRLEITVVEVGAQTGAGVIKTN